MTKRLLRSSPTSIIGAGMIVLDIVLNNGSHNPIHMAGGSCGNVLSGLSFMGWRSIAISRAGQDIARAIMVKDLERDGVDTAFVTEEVRVETPRIIEKVNSNGQYTKHSFALRCSTCNTYLPRFHNLRTNMPDEIKKAYRTTDVFFFDKSTTPILRMAKYYHDLGSLVVFEPKHLDNLEEAERAMGVASILKYAETESTQIEFAKSKQVSRIQKRKRIPLIIRTRGQAGVYFKMIGNNSWYRRKSFPPAQIIDTCGAGDWSTVGFLFHLERLAQRSNTGLLQLLNSKVDIDEAIRFGQILSSLKCMFVGARSLSTYLNRDEVISIVESYLHSKKSRTIRLSDKHPMVEWKNSGLPLASTIHLCPTCLLRR